MNLKSEKLKKLEIELKDLEQWLHLGLVPKKDIKKHEVEIANIKEKITEEVDRLRFLKENGDLEEFVAPKKSQRQAYAEPHTVPDLDMGLTHFHETSFDMDTTSFETDSTMREDRSEGGEGGAEEEEEDEELEDDDPFSDKNRWKRGVLEDPDADNW